MREKKQVPSSYSQPPPNTNTSVISGGNANDWPVAMSSVEVSDLYYE